MATVRPLPAPIGGFAAFRLELLLRARIGPALEEDEQLGLDPRLVAQVRAAYADLVEAARQWSEARGSAPGTAEPPQVDAGAASAHELSTSDAAGALACSERWVRRLLADGVLAGRLAAGRWVVDAESLELYVATRRSA